MQYIRPIVWLALPLLFLSCGSNNDQQSFEPSNLQGTWQSQSNIIFYEHWEMKSDSVMMGLAFSVNGTDTLLLEQMSMAYSKEGLYFEANVTDQNKGQTIRFMQIASSKNQLVFENLQHDYPNRITYTLHDDSTLTAVIENSRGNKQKRFEFKKVKQ